MKKICSVIFTVLFFSYAAKAGISIDDRWEENGLLVARGTNWEAQFSKKEKAIVLRVWHEDVAQSIRLTPFSRDNIAAEGIADLKLQSQEGTKTAVDVTFSGGGAEVKSRFCFDDNGIAEITPLAGMQGVRIEGDIRYGFLPGIFLEDIVYDPEKETGLSEIYVPSENIVAGFLGEGNGIFICAWPEGNQKAKILLGKKDGKNYIQGIEVILDGKKIYAGLLTRKGIWYQASFPDESRGKDIKVPWKMPFAAAWKTQLLVSDIETCFMPLNYRRDAQENIDGYRVYPVWFNKEGEVFFHLSGKVFLKEKRAFIYPFEEHSETLMGFLNRTPLGEYFTKMRKPEWPYSPPRLIPWVGFISCPGTILLRNTIIKAGIQDREQEFLDEWISAALNANEGTQNRRENYGRLINGMIKKIASEINNEKNPDAAGYLRAVEQIVVKTEKVYSDIIKGGRGGYSSPAEYVAYAKKLGERLRKIIPCPGTEFFPEYDYIIHELNSVTWGQQEKICEVGVHLRECFQMAGYNCRNNPEAIKYAEEIRKNIRDFLRARIWETTEVTYKWEPAGW